MKPTARQIILERIALTSAEDFDGHTDFQQLTPRQKLQWISAAACFVHVAAKNNPQVGCARFSGKERLPDQ